MNEIKNKQHESHTKKTQPKKKKMKKNGFKKILVVIAFIFVILMTIFIIKMNDNGWTYGGLLATILGHNSNTKNQLDTIYVVLTGESQNLTDTIMICAFSPKKNKIVMMSVPRDTYTGKNKNKATASDKINTLYKKSPDALKNKISDITGMKIENYINVDTKGLRELVDAIGGVDYDVPINMDYDDDTQNLHIHLKAGYQKLDGNGAEQLVRFRHNNDGSSYPASYGDNDIGRMRTQREFLKILLSEMKHKHLISNLKEYTRIAKANVSTNLDLDNMIDYVPYLIDFNFDEIDSNTLPGNPEKCNGVWLFIPNTKKIKEIVDEKFVVL